MKRQVFIAGVLTLIVVAALGAVKALQIKKAIAEGKNRKMPPASVTSFAAMTVEWPLEHNAVGELAPVQGAVLAAEELGRVTTISFESGSAVRQGQVLVDLDTSVEAAQLQAAQAALELSALELKRQRALRSNNANAVSDLDKADAAHRAAVADVEHLKARVERKRIIAPFAGVTGARLVNEGQVIPPGTPVVSLQSLDKLYLNFSTPQRVIGSLRPGLAVQFRVDAFPQRDFSGTLTTVEPAVDAKTRNIGLQATVENQDGSLRPGMFADVKVLLPKTETLTVIPAAGVSFAPYGDTVYLIEEMKGPDGSAYLGARPQTVKLGRRRGDLIAVLSGVKAGDQIVSSGTFKLMPGAPVLVNNTVSPGTETNPQPADS